MFFHTHECELVEDDAKSFPSQPLSFSDRSGRGLQLLKPGFDDIYLALHSLDRPGGMRMLGGCSKLLYKGIAATSPL